MSFVLDNSISSFSMNKSNVDNLNHSKFYKEEKKNISSSQENEEKNQVTVIRNENNDNKSNNNSINNIDNNKPNDIMKYKKFNSSIEVKPIEKPRFVEKKYTIKKDKKLNVLYWQVLKIHNSLINLLFNRLKFNRRNMKLVYILCSISMTITVNAMMYSESYIHKNYYYLYSINTLKYIIIHQIKKSIYSFLISFILTIPLNYLCLGYNGLEKMVAKKEKKKNIEYIQEMNKSHTKVIWFCFVNFILQLIYLYYTILFCYIYKNSQINFFKSSIVSIIMGYIGSFISALFISWLGKFSAISGNSKFKNIMKKIIYGDLI